MCDKKHITYIFFILYYIILYYIKLYYIILYTNILYTNKCHQTNKYIYIHITWLLNPPLFHLFSKSKSRTLLHDHSQGWRQGNEDHRNFHSLIAPQQWIWDYWLTHRNEAIFQQKFAGIWKCCHVFIKFIGSCRFYLLGFRLVVLRECPMILYKNCKGGHPGNVFHGYYCTWFFGNQKMFPFKIWLVFSGILNVLSGFCFFP